jgi:predicted Rossmann fold flavoprotein
MGSEVDLAVVGAGAAGMMAALLAARERPGWRIILFEASPRPGTKILASGGGRCNVTNSVVTETDFCGGSRAIVRRVLRAFPVTATRDLLSSLGVDLVEEEHGKLFPSTHRATTVQRALLDECIQRGVEVLCSFRVRGITKDAADGFILTGTGNASRHARRVLLTAGGRSYPRTGSDGSGYDLARALGHALVVTTPALVPLVLADDLHAGLSGVAHEAELALLSHSARPWRRRGSLLWTHFGVSGPVVLDASRHWERARVESRGPRLLLNVLPGLDFSAADALLLHAARRSPTAALASTLGRVLPRALAQACARWAGLSPAHQIGQLSREDRRRVVHALVETELPVTASRGWNHAEVTAGGVPLSEVHPATLESRVCPGLFLAGEILDVDGRLGGFNFQWAWSSAWVAAHGITRG